VPAPSDMRPMHTLQGSISESRTTQGRTYEPSASEEGWRPTADEGGRRPLVGLARAGTPRGRGGADEGGRRPLVGLAQESTPRGRGAAGEGEWRPPVGLAWDSTPRGRGAAVGGDHLDGFAPLGFEGRLPTGIDTPPQEGGREPALSVGSGGTTSATPPKQNYPGAAAPRGGVNTAGGRRGFFTGGRKGWFNLGGRGGGEPPAPPAHLGYLGATPEPAPVRARPPTPPRCTAPLASQRRKALAAALAVGY